MISTGLSHIGFGLLVLGTLTSGLNSYHLNNPFLFSGQGADPEFAEKYIQLIKGKPLYVRDHLVTYQSDTLVGNKRFYDIEFKSVNKALEVTDSFKLRPNSQYSNDFSKVAAFNPDTKHYFTRDIFSCIVNLPPHLTETQKMKEMEDSLKYTTFKANINDTTYTQNYKYVIRSISTNPTTQEYKAANHELGIEIMVDVFNKKSDYIKTVAASVGLEGSLIYTYPGKIEEEYISIKPSEEIFESFLTKEEELNYQYFEIKKGERFQMDGYDFLLTGFDKNPTSKNYQAEEGDIAVGAVLEISKDQKAMTSRPMYVIRGTSPMSIKDYIASEGLHIRLSNINPNEEKFTFKVAKDDRKDRPIPFSVAENVPRSDYIILQATVFPGIKLYWIGGLMMMLGLLWGWINKLRLKLKS
jgi:cytochrome c-type biogenesis protein CcmF